MNRYSLNDLNQMETYLNYLQLHLNLNQAIQNYLEGIYQKYLQLHLNLNQAIQMNH